MLHLELHHKPRDRTLPVRDVAVRCSEQKTVREYGGNYIGTYIVRTVGTEYESVVIRELQYLNGDKYRTVTNLSMPTM